MSYLSDFFLKDSPQVSLLYGIYNPWLVFLSLAVAIFSSCMAMQIAGMAKTSKSVLHRRIAISTGALTLACGVWAMHFIGMLAFRLCIPVNYAHLPTIFSVLPALGASWVALYLLTRQQISAPQVIVSGILVGVGIGSMHYIGMSAMQMNATLLYAPWPFALSIVVAILLSILALWIRFGLHEWPHPSSLRSILSSGLVMGLAMSAMHYTGMLGVRIVGTATSLFPLMATGAIFVALIITSIIVTLTALIVFANGAIRYRQLFYQMQFNESRLQAIFDTAVDGIITVNRDGIVQSLNRSMEIMFGWKSADIVGKNVSLLIPEFSHAQLDIQHGLQLDDSTEARDVGRDVTGIRKDGSTTPIRLAIGKVTQPGHAMFVGIISDISERKKAEEKINFIAFHDVLTELPNRILLQDRFEQAMAHADREHSKIGLLFLDLDNFKTINDSLGHTVGDSLIKSVAVRLKECVRSTDTVSRHGGDEFLVIIRNLPDTESAAPILAKMMNYLLRPYDIDGVELQTSASIGIAIYPDDGADFDTIMKKADMSMYRAKEAGRNTYRFFDEKMTTDVVEQLNIRSGLRRALECNEFVLHYQPQIDLNSGKLIGAEALIRWQHPEHGLIYPGRFIQVAEDSGIIVEMGEWVLREACRQAVEWHQSGIDGLIMAVNLSAVQFKRSDLVQSVTSVLTNSGINPALLELELTESILIADTEQILVTVKRLKQLGLKLSIDDFGTGYSSLSYLKYFDVDKLKIDQSFVRDLANDKDDAQIVRAIIQLANGLGLSTIAEGVENIHSLNLLKGLGCEEAQGYHIARPMPAADFPTFARNLAHKLEMAEQRVATLGHI